MRIIPELKGLQSLMGGRSAKRAMVGLALLVPAVGFMASVPGLDPTRNGDQQIEERSRAELVSEAWRERMDDLSRAEVVQALASEFDVPVNLAADIHEAAVSEKIDPRMAFGLVRAESRFRTTIVSPVGAVGLTQVMPATARWLVPGTSRKDLMNPETNLKVGFKYLRSLLNRYEGDSELALTAYNRGPGTVSKFLDAGRDPDNGYAEMVMTGKSAKHVSLMNAKFGAKPKHAVKAKKAVTPKKFKASSVRRRSTRP